MDGFNHPQSETSLDSPGSVVLQALYDYQYRSEDGKQVTILEGEIFHLVHKANEDWWQVKRFSQPKQKRPIFVPASYVAEVTYDELQQNGFLHPGIHSEKDGGPGELFFEVQGIKPQLGNFNSRSWNSQETLFYLWSPHHHNS